MTSSNTEFDLTEKSDILIKTAFGFPSTNENTPWYSEVFIPFDNYVFGDEVLVEGVPSSPVFDTVKTASDINLDTSDFTNYSADTNNISGCSIVDDSTGTVRRYQGLILDTISNGLNANADGSQSWRKLDGNGNNILKNGLQFNYKQQGATQPYLYLLSKKNGGSIPFGSSGGNWYIDLKSGVLLFNDYSTSICSVSNPPVLTYYTYIGKKGLSNFAGGGGGGTVATGTNGALTVSGDIVGQEDLELNAGIIIQDDYLFDTSAARLFPDARFEKLEVRQDLSVYGDLSVNAFSVGKIMNFSGDIEIDTLNTTNIIQFDRNGTPLDVDLSGDVYRNSITTFGNIDAGGMIIANGDISANGKIIANGDISANGKIIANGDISANGNLSVLGTLEFDNLNVTSINASGNVGIGTNNPARHLTIYANSYPTLQLAHSSSGTSTNNGFEIYQGGSSTEIANYENGSMSFWTNGTRQMKIQSNGYVGIGTTSPAYKMDIVGTDTMLRLTNLDASGRTTQIFKTDNADWEIGARGSTNGSAPSSFYIYDTNYRMVINSSGYVGIGTSSPNHPLHIVGSGGSLNAALYAYHHSGDSWKYHSGNIWNSGTTPIGLRVNEGIICQRQYFMSDERIKTDIVDIQDDAALLQFRQLKPKTYYYKDKITYGEQKVFGFLAQDVSAVIPGSCTLITEYIPNIMSIADISAIDISANECVLKIEIAHQFEVNDIISCRDSQGMEINDISVVEIVDSNTIKIDKIFTSIESTFTDNDTGYQEENKMFVYGKKIEDFHNLNKESIWTIATAALQEVDRQQQADKARIATLETENATLKTQMADVLARLAALETA